MLEFHECLPHALASAQPLGVVVSTLASHAPAGPKALLLRPAQLLQQQLAADGHEVAATAAAGSSGQPRLLQRLGTLAQEAQQHNHHQHHQQQQQQPRPFLSMDDSFLDTGSAAWQQVRTRPATAGTARAAGPAASTGPRLLRPQAGMQGWGSPPAAAAVPAGRHSGSPIRSCQHQQSPARGAMAWTNPPAAEQAAAAGEWRSGLSPMRLRARDTAARTYDLLGHLQQQMQQMQQPTAGPVSTWASSPPLAASPRQPGRAQAAAGMVLMPQAARAAAEEPWRLQGHQQRTAAPAAQSEQAGSAAAALPPGLQPLLQLLSAAAQPAGDTPNTLVTLVQALTSLQPLLQQQQQQRQGPAAAKHVSAAVQEAAAEPGHEGRNVAGSRSSSRAAKGPGAGSTASPRSAASAGQGGIMDEWSDLHEVSWAYCWGSWGGSVAWR